MTSKFSWLDGLTNFYGYGAPPASAEGARGSSAIKAKINSLTVRADLTRYGFLINEEKSLWEPVQVITWLGTVFDTFQGVISLLNAGFLS